jgi:hypothetical protein
MPPTAAQVGGRSADRSAVFTLTRRADRLVDALGGLVVLGGWLAWALEATVSAGACTAGVVLALGRGAPWGWLLAAAGLAWLVALLGGRLRPGWWFPPFW